MQDHIYDRFPHPYDKADKKIHEWWEDLTNPVHVDDLVDLYKKAKDGSISPKDREAIKELAIHELEQARANPEQHVPAHALLLHGYAQQVLKYENGSQDGVNEYLIEMIQQHASFMEPIVFATPKKQPLDLVEKIAAAALDLDFQPGGYDFLLTCPH